MKASGYSRLASSSRQYSGGYCLHRSYTAAFSARCSSVNVNVMSFIVSPLFERRLRRRNPNSWGRPRRGPSRPPPTNLLSFELGLALLVERAYALQAVLGRDGIVVRLDGEGHRRLQIRLAPPVDGLLRLPHGDGAIVGDGGGDLEGLGACLPRGHEVVHEADGLGFLGADTAPREDH